MRIEELANNNFTKGTDSVERYLLDIIKQYFSSNNVNEDSREYIISKAVERMKADLKIDNAGVLSVNGQVGDVNITLDSLGGEPLISPKLSAFNVDFGNTENTACAGDDPRLSDSRNPLPHMHELSEVNGLIGELSTIRNTINSLTNAHRHDNLDVLRRLIYSGNSDTIDLTILDTIQDTADNLSSRIDTNITEAKTDIDNLLTLSENNLNMYNNEFINIQSYIDAQDINIQTITEAYCDTKLDEKKTEIKALIDNILNKGDLNTIINIINQQFSVIYETFITSFITSANSDIVYTVNLDTTTTNELAALSDAQYKINLFIKYIDPDTGETINTELPFVYAKSGELLYTIKGELINKSIIRITSSKKDSAVWPSFINSAIIKVKVYKANNLSGV